MEGVLYKWTNYLSGESSVNVDHTDVEECDDTAAGGSVVKTEEQSEAVSAEEPQAGCS
ncbi:UNVERIFIED_CONTAM: hypothetical protein FKN15_061356 [Acipenser sinensis]